MPVFPQTGRILEARIDALNDPGAQNLQRESGGIDQASSAA